MHKFRFDIDYRYICGRDNYTCQNVECNKNLDKFSVLFKKINEAEEESEINLFVVCQDCLNKDFIYKPLLKDFSGRLIVITGPMFSQKSTTMKSLYNKYKFPENATDIWVKPEKDNRRKDFTKTHDNELIGAFTINAERPDLSLSLLSKYTVIAFDECQFFSERIIYVIHRLLEKGSLIIVNGLKLSAKRELFGAMHYLLAEADEIHSLKSICNCCQLVDYATRTKPFNTDTPLISIGGEEQYYAVCPKCDGSINEKRFLKKSLQKEKS